MRRVTMVSESRSLQLTLAQAPALLRAGQAPVPLGPRDGALLAWLALEGPTPRGRLAQLLWPESEPESARNALRQRLFQLKKLLGVEVVSGGATLALAEGLTHDLTDSDRVLGEGLHDFGAELSAWLVQQRERRGARVRQSLVELCEMAASAGDYADALSHADELLALEPLSEEAHRRVMRLHYLRGDRAGALLAFDRCEQVLKDEVGASPSADTLALLGDVERSAAALGMRASVLPAALLRPPCQTGREPELAAVLAAWHAGQRFLVLGEPGMGKSRLLDSVADGWSGALLIRARPGDGAVPLALASRLVEAVCTRHSTALLRPAVQALRRVLAESSASLAGASSRPVPMPLVPPLGELLTLGLGDTPPLALMFDDWQFADDASVALLTEVLAAPALSGLRHGHASRSSAGRVAQRRIDSLCLEGERRVVTLAPLPADALAALVESLGLCQLDAAGLGEALHRRVGGNPLYALEVLRHMHERGVPMQGRHVLAPQHVRALVRTRLDDLADGARRLMRIAAVAGVDFNAELAEAVSGQHVLDLSDTWGTLQQLGLFDTRGVAHDVYTEAVLEILPEPISRVLHGRVAAWLETRPCEAARLAGHWRAAGEDLRAVPHLLGAARQAWHAALGSQVFDLYRQAADIAAASGDTQQAFEHWFLNAEAMTEVGSPALLQQCLEALQPLAVSERDGLRVRLIRAVAGFGGVLERSVDEVGHLLGDAIALGDTRVESECRFALASRAVGEGRFDEGLAQLAAAERLLRDAGDTRRAAAHAASMAMVQGLRGQTRVALREQHRLLPVLQQEGDQATWSVLRASSALQHARRGETAEALLAVQEALAAMRRASIAPPDTLIAWRYLVEVLRWAGDFGAALDLCEEFTERLDRQGHYPRGQIVPAALYLHLGRPDLARPLLQAARAGMEPRARELLRLQLIELELAFHLGGVAGAASIEGAWADAAIGCEDVALAAEWALWSGLLAESPWTTQALHALALRCERSELHVLLRAVQVLAAWRSQQAGEDTPVAARASLRQLPEALPGLLAIAPWAALYGARAFVAVGDAASARTCAQAGERWLRQCVNGAMPDAFRDSFLHRHPLHRTLLAEAARLA